MSWSKVFEAIGTRWQIDIYDHIDHDLGEQIYQKISDFIETFDFTYSRFRPDSIVSKIARQAGIYSLPENSRALFEIYKKLYDLTEGAMTPLIGDTLIQAGYDSDYSLRVTKLTNPARWEDVIDFQHPVLHTKKPVTLDFGAAGKGYLIDLVGGIIMSAGCKSFCIDAGGDILYRTNTSKSIRVGLENPTNTSQIIGVVDLHNQSICGSAGNRKNWGGFHHILNPHTLQSPKHILALWTVADNTLVADALTTALFFTEPEKLKKEFNFEYLLLFPDYSVKKSSGFKAELFKA